MHSLPVSNKYIFQEISLLLNEGGENNLVRSATKITTNYILSEIISFSFELILSHFCNIFIQDRSVKSIISTTMEILIPLNV